MLSRARGESRSTASTCVQLYAAAGPSTRRFAAAQDEVVELLFTLKSGRLSRVSLSACSRRHLAILP